MKPLPLFLLLPAALLAFSRAGAASPLGEIILKAGPVTTQNGKISFTEWSAGQFLKTNPFSQYRGPDYQTSSKVDVARGSAPKNIQLRENLEIGQLLQTGPAGYARLLLKDDSIIDLGPQTLFAIERFEMAENLRHITLKLLKGKIRVLVTRKLQGQSTYLVSTPGVMTWVRGTDFIVHTEHPAEGEKGRVRATVLGVRGQVTCDLVRNVRKGEVYFQPYIVNTYSMLTVQSADGFVFETSLRDRLSMKDYSEQWDLHAPLTDPIASALGMHPGPGALPGTGVTRTNRPQIIEEKKIPTQLSEELEAEHPTETGARLTASHNFQAPHDLDQEPSLVNHRLRPLLRQLVPDATDRLPYEALRVAAPDRVPIR